MVNQDDKPKVSQARKEKFLRAMERAVSHAEIRRYAFEIGMDPIEAVNRFGRNKTTVHPDQLKIEEES